MACKPVTGQLVAEEEEQGLGVAQADTGASGGNAVLQAVALTLCRHQICHLILTRVIVEGGQGACQVSAPQCLCAHLVLTPVIIHTLSFTQGVRSGL